MPIQQRNRPLLNKKEFQMMGLIPVATSAAAFMISPQDDNANVGMYVTSNTVQYLYHHDEDGFTQIPSGAIAGTFGAGACGHYHPWSIAYTANGGSVNTLTVPLNTHNITGVAIGSTIEILTGSAIGQRRIVTGLRNTAVAGSTITLTVDRPFSAAIVNTDTFRLATGRYYVLGAGTTAAGSWRTFDLATMAWQASLSIVGFPATWATDGRIAQGFSMPYLHVTGSATGGSTTTLPDTSKAWIIDEWKGYHCNFIDGTGEGQIVKILSNTANTLTFETALAVAPAAASIYEIRSKPAFAVGLATSATSTTIVQTGKTWATSQWINYVVRIVSGTGAGQQRVITANTATTLTVATWTVTPDTTSVYEIEGNENLLYVAGNAGVAMYTYNISANTWATLAPGAARAVAPSTGMSLNWVGNTGDSVWGNESDILNGKYIYSFQGGGTAALHRYNISTNTWETVTYIGTETFTTGSSADVSGRYIYLRQAPSNRFFKYSIRGNYLEPFSQNSYPDGAVVLGQKVWVKSLDPGGVIKWVYAMMNTGTVMHRIMII